ncbi:MAG: hypothetical protein R6U26_01680 [Candidatus Undinarchaeales archaeon]
MVRTTGDDWKTKLTPVEEVDKLPDGIMKLLRLLKTWSNGRGEAFKRSGKKVRKKLRGVPVFELKKYLTHVDLSGTARVSKLEVEVKGNKYSVFIKRTFFNNELEALKEMKGTRLSGELFGYLEGARLGPDFIIREFVPGIDHRGIDLGRTSKGDLKKIARSLGNKLRKIHEIDINLSWDSDIIFDLNSGEAYFVDFDRISKLNSDGNRASDAASIKTIFSRTRKDYHAPLWEIFLNNYGKDYKKKFSEGRLKKYFK